MKSANGEQFGELAGPSSLSVNAAAAVNSHHTALAEREKPFCSEDDAICFRYSYGGHQHADQAFSDKNNNIVNRTAPCCEGLPSDFFSATDDPTDLSHITQHAELEGDFCDSIASTLGAEAQTCTMLDIYLNNTQNAVDGGDANGQRENGGMSMTIRADVRFSGEKRHGGQSYVCGLLGDKRNLSGRQSPCGEGFERALACGTAPKTLQPNLGEGRNYVETERKKNGQSAHERICSNGVSVVDEAEILQPQAKFQQRSSIHKFGRGENPANTGFQQASSMLIAEGEVSGEHSRTTVSPQSLDPLIRDKRVFDAINSPQESTLLVEDLMSPDQRTNNTTTRPSGRTKNCNDMRLLSESVNSTLSADVSMDSPEALLRQAAFDKRKVLRNETQTGEFVTDEKCDQHFRKKGDSPRNSEARNSREYDAADSVVQQNGGEALPQNNGNAAVEKHIYPWMKESRQNTRRKQSTSSNCSSNGGDKLSKRERTAYTNSQLVELEKEFHFNRYLCRPRRIEMAQMLSLTERQIKIWFQNRRMKYKKDQKLKAMPSNALGRDETYYHQHYHHGSSNVSSDPVFSRNNGHRHYSNHADHMHSGDAPYGPGTTDTPGTTQGGSGIDFSAGRRCYHGHRHQGCHINQDSSAMGHRSVGRSSSNSFDGTSRPYPPSSQKGNSNGRLTSPSSSSSNDTLSPGNCQSAGAFATDVGLRPTPCSVEGQGLPQTEYGMKDNSTRMREESTIEMRGHRLENGSGYDVSFAGHSISVFHRNADDVAGRMNLGPCRPALASQMPMQDHHRFFGGYERPRETASISMLAEASSAHLRGQTRYEQVPHSPLESLADCVHRSPRDFPHQTVHPGHALNGGRYPLAEGYPEPFTAAINGVSFDRSRFERPVNHFPLDFSRSKSSSPRMYPNAVYINNRLTRL